MRKRDTAGSRDRQVGRWLTGALALGALAVSPLPAVAAPAGADDVLETYAAIAQAGYEDSLVAARALSRAVDGLLAAPSAETLATARAAWRAARVPYSQTEVFRFGNPIVDDWEGRVNAWPLDEGLIDYVVAEGSQAATVNVIANTSFTMAGETVDASRITPALLRDRLHELGGIEANVATGYHAIEFLLWGQDRNGTGPGAGERPWTDYASGDACTNAPCDRRATYLRTAVDLLVEDLAWMAGQWAPGGAARADLTEGGTSAGLARIIRGLGSLGYGELAGERMKLGLMLHDPEEEQDCFSDNTHESHYGNLAGIINVATGTYTRTDGRKVVGMAISDLVAEAAPALNRELLARLAASEAAMAALRHRAETVEAYDQMIGPDNAAGNAVVQAVVDALSAQTQAMERVAGTLGLTQVAFEGSDSLDDPEAVFQ